MTTIALGWRHAPASITSERPALGPIVKALMPRGEVPHSDRCAPGATNRRGSPALLSEFGALTPEISAAAGSRAKNLAVAGRWLPDGDVMAVGTAPPPPLSSVPTPSSWPTFRPAGTRWARGARRAVPARCTIGAHPPGKMGDDTGEGGTKNGLETPPGPCLPGFSPGLRAQHLHLEPGDTGRMLRVVREKRHAGGKSVGTDQRDRRPRRCEDPPSGGRFRTEARRASRPMRWASEGRRPTRRAQCARRGACRDPPASALLGKYSTICLSCVRALHDAPCLARHGPPAGRAR